MSVAVTCLAMAGVAASTGTAAQASTPAVVPTATSAVVYHSWSHSASGVAITGGRWWYANGRLEVDGTVADTGGDGRSAFLQLHFVKDCCSNKIKNSKGVGTTLYFHKAASATGTMQFRTKVGTESTFYYSATDWVYRTTFQ
ncbi:hypothetical protein [Pedococcus dokdonensis]|nr:hypothetical protein [Pedococcus dokdonensis]